MGEVRKLQKKLRQIENLEIKVSLNLEENIKISRKAELRSRLAELLLQHSDPQPAQEIVGELEDKMKRQMEEATMPHDACPPSLKMPREAERDEESRADDGTETQHLPVSHAAEEGEDSEFRSHKQAWEQAKFRLRTLVGHSDIVTCVVAVDNHVISGSRDTTVKVWHVPTATEQKNLGGHRGGVTCLSAPAEEYCRRMARVLHLPDKERFVLSGSTDCCVRVWALSSGQCVKSIYTFNAVTSMCFIPEGDGFIVSGSDAGKLQVWSWSSLENRQVLNAHLDAVTTLQSHGPLLFSGSVEGSVCVWEVLLKGQELLRRLHSWGSEVTGCGGADGSYRRLTLSPRGDRVFLSCGRASIRILNWRTGEVSKLTNHSSTAAVTDGVGQVPSLLMASCYDLTTGESRINLFSLPHCKYLVSLTSTDLPRILCFATWLTSSGGHRWVTGGRDLIVWEQLPGTFRKKGDVTIRRDCRLDACILESDSDSEDDRSEGDEEDEEDSATQDPPDAEESSRSSWLRCVLQ